MEELNDDELQELLSRGAGTGDDLFTPKENSDLLAYQKLFDTLAEEPSQGLSFSFAANVRRKIQEQLNRKSDRRFNLLAVTIFALSLVLAYCLLMWISPATGGLILNVVLKFKWVLSMMIMTFFCLLISKQRDVRTES